MADGKEIRIKLTADTSDYIAAIEKASQVTSALAEQLRALGLTDTQIPGAIQAVLKLVDTTPAQDTLDRFRDTGDDEGTGALAPTA
jgi:hypothetical protein